LPTGKREYLIDPKALLLDVIFNDHSRLLPISVDRMATSAGYTIKKALRSILPPSLRPDTPPQSRYMPTTRNIYRSLHVEDGATPATRHTVSAATPQLPVGRVALSGELRLQWKRPPKPIAPVVARDNRLPMSLTCSDGRTGTLEVPAWLAHTLEIAQDGAAAIIPKGARSSFDRFLGELEAQTDPVQHATIAQFRQGAGTAIQDAMFLRTPKADEVRAFLSQFVSRESVGETNPRSQESGPESLSAAYHPAGQPYPSAEPPLPATFRMQQTTPSNALPNSLPTPSGEPLRLMTTFRPPEVRQVPGSSRVSGPFGLVSGMSGVHLTSQTRSATASINPGELEAGLAALGVSPERARAFAAEVNNPNARETIVVSRTSGGSEEHDAAGGQIQPQPFGPRRLSSQSTEEIAALSLDDIRRLTVEQIGELTPQLDALSVEHLRILRATHRKDLGPEQTASLKDALMRARWKEFRHSAATFVTMSTSSYILFSTAPSHWLATGAAVGFGLGGGVFLTQAAFPSATALNTTLGRWLNGVSGARYVLTLPGGVAAALQGINPWVNWSYSVGSAIFAVKSIRQAVTGRVALRNLSERWGEGLFVVGSVPYTLQSIGSGSLLGAIGGAAFAYGCGYYMVRAGRDDVVMRRPVPSTEMEIAAAEKSEARWARHDRNVLGIAFGGGMLAFSLDALLAQPWDVAETDDPDDLNPELRSPTEETQPPRHLGREIEPHSETPEQPQQPRQLGVLEDGSVDLQPATSTSEIKTRGTPVEETGERLTDHAGSEWKAVGQYGPNALDYAGSLSASLAEPRAEGIQNSEGRFNWELEEQGYNWVEARAGQSISSIARSRGVGVAETVMLNMNHIVDPSLVFSGDRIYIPQALSSSVLAQSQPARSKLLSAGAIRL
jgi:hypothetical protein